MQPIEFQRPVEQGLVSVIIPTHNGDKFIGDALDSIAAQTYDRWEVIVVEDGTRGETEAIVQRFAAAHPGNRVHYQRSEQANGPSHTRNVAFTLAAGEWVAFLDCDDRWLPNHLSTCVAALTDHAADVAYSAALMCEDGTDHVLGHWGPTHAEVADFPRSLLGRSYITPSATVIRRTLLRDVGPWNTTCRYGEDADFFLRAAKIRKTFRYVGGVHCLYRKNHAEAATRNIAATIEAWATVASWYPDLPGVDRKHAERASSQSFALAARLHGTGDTAADPSADRSRAAPLYYRAWRLKPKHIGYLFQTIRYAIRHGYSREEASQRRQQLESGEGTIAAPAKAAA